MLWLIIALGYLLGSIPTAYLIGRLLKGKDIRQMGDGNMGARNAFYQLGHKTGIVIFFFDAAKGALPGSYRPSGRSAPDSHLNHWCSYRGWSQLANFPRL